MFAQAELALLFVFDVLFWQVGRVKFDELPYTVAILAFLGETKPSLSWSLL